MAFNLNTSIGFLTPLPNNVIIGPSDTKGTYNSIIGANNLCDGHYNIIIGTDNVVVGSYNIIFGHHLKVFGDDHHFSSSVSSNLLLFDKKIIYNMMILIYQMLPNDVIRYIIKYIYDINLLTIQNYK